MEKILEFKDLNFEYNDDLFFEDFNMSINEKDIISLIGPSKSGKTTLLKMLCHKLPNESCYYKGECFKDIPTDILRKEIVVVFDKQINEYTVKDELLQNLYKLNLSTEEINEKYTQIKDFFDLESIENKQISELSYKDIYLIKILRYLIIVPSIIAIDCIFSLLSESNKRKLIDFIKVNNITLINVVNDLNDTIYGNKIYVLDDFEIIMSGNTSSVLKADTLLKRLGFSLPLPVDLSIGLINYDILKKVYLDSDKLVGALWK